MLRENFIFEFLTAGLLATAIGYFSYVTLKIFNLRRKYAHIPGPPTKGIIGFYFGNFLEIIYNEKVNKRVTNDLVLDWYKFKFIIMEEITQNLSRRLFFTFFSFN
jgi:hypothetical protein